MSFETRWADGADYATVRRSNRGWTVLHLYGPNAPMGPLAAYDSHHQDLAAALAAAEKRNRWRDERRAADAARRERTPWVRPSASR